VLASPALDDEHQTQLRRVIQAAGGE